MADTKAPRPAQAPVPGSGASDLPEDVIQQIEELHARLGTLDHYALLGLPRSATKAEIRTAFLRVAPRFHPDRYFGRKMGAFGEKMLRIFGHMSTAHDTLVSEEKRAEYERTLPPALPPGSPAGAIAGPPPSSRRGPPPLPPGVAAPPSSRGAPSSSPGSSPPSRRASSEPARAPSEPVRSSQLRAPASSHPTNPASHAMRASSPSSPSSSQPARSANQPARAPSDPGERPSATVRSTAPSAAEIDRAQQAFAARLGGQGRMRAAAPSTPGQPGGGPGASRRGSSPSNQVVDPKMATEALRRRYEEKMGRVRSTQTSKHVEAAKTAESVGNFAEAARLYKVALEHSSDVTLKAARDQAESRAKEQLHAEAVRRAKEAEQKQDFAEAGVSWARAFDLVPHAETAHRAAALFRRADGDPRRAARYGEEAVKLDPNKAGFRVTLAMIYADAGLMLRARGEIERAQALEPTNPQVKEALSRLKGR